MKKSILLLGVAGLALLFSQALSAQAPSDSSGPLASETIDTIYSAALGEERVVWVKLPQEYDPIQAEKYPVVYLLDGFSLRNTLETVYENYRGHYLPPMILVGIANRTHRTRDLTPSRIKLRGSDTWDEETGGAEAFIQFLEKELIPYIDLTYPTTPYRTLIGHSYGGLFTIHTLLQHRHLFENYLAIDPSLNWDDQRILRQAKQQLASGDYRNKSLFVSLAAEQLHMWNEAITLDNVMKDTSEFTSFARSIIEFADVAAAHSPGGLDFSWQVYPEDLHGTVPLPSMRDGLVALFEWFQFKSPQQYNNPDTPVGKLRSLLKTQQEIYERQLGYSVPPMVEELMNAYGYMNMQMEQPAKALLFFELQTKHYPNSANAYDSLADYYEAAEDYATALKYVTRAHALNASADRKRRMEELRAKQ